MKSSIAFSTLALAGGIAAWPAGIFQRDASDGCTQLSNLYANQTLFPNTDDYTFESTDFWSQTCYKSPYCIFLPNSAEDMASAIKIAVSTNTTFSLKGRGHMPVPGASSNDGGIMISTRNLSFKEWLNDDKSVASIGPGQPWSGVYAWASESGRAIPGGRYSPVGVAGLLLGGGINHFGPQHGFSMANIVNYEVVLANGTIVNANETSHPDLFWAMHGGSNNFGIVTRFNIKAYEVTDVYGGISQVAGAENIAGMWEAVNAFVQPGGGIEDIYSVINPTFTMSPNTGEVSSATNIIFHQGSDASPQSLSNFTGMPTVFSTNSLRQSYANFTADTAISEYRDERFRYMFRVTALKIAPQTLSLINETITGPTIEALKDVANCTANIFPQPISTQWMQASVDAGGDPIGLDPADGSIIVVGFGTTWLNAEDDETVYANAKTVLDDLEAKAKEQDIYYPFVYLNDAAPGQEPFPLYRNIDRMRAIRAQYDPENILQTLETSGFKLGTETGSY